MRWWIAAALAGAIPIASQPAPAGEFAEAKVGDLRFPVTAAGAAPAQTFALVPGHDGAIAFLHTGSRAFKKAATKES